MSPKVKYSSGDVGKQPGDMETQPSTKSKWKCKKLATERKFYRKENVIYVFKKFDFVLDATLEKLFDHYVSHSVRLGSTLDTGRKLNVLKMPHTRSVMPFYQGIWRPKIVIIFNMIVFMKKAPPLCLPLEFFSVSRSGGGRDCGWHILLLLLIITFRICYSIKHVSFFEK